MAYYQTRRVPGQDTAFAFQSLHQHGNPHARDITLRNRAQGLKSNQNPVLSGAYKTWRRRAVCSPHSKTEPRVDCTGAGRKRLRIGCSAGRKASWSISTAMWAQSKDSIPDSHLKLFESLDLALGPNSLKPDIGVSPWLDARDMQPDSEQHQEPPTTSSSSRASCWSPVSAHLESGLPIDDSHNCPKTVFGISEIVLHTTWILDASVSVEDNADNSIDGRMR